MRTAYLVFALAFLLACGKDKSLTTPVQPVQSYGDGEYWGPNGEPNLSYYWVQGIVTDSISGDPVVGAYVEWWEGNGDVTDSNGYYLCGWHVDLISEYWYDSSDVMDVIVIADSFPEHTRLLYYEEIFAQDTVTKNFQLVQ